MRSSSCWFSWSAWRSDPYFWFVPILAKAIRSEHHEVVSFFSPLDPPREPRKSPVLLIALLQLHTV